MQGSSTPVPASLHPSTYQHKSLSHICSPSSISHSGKFQVQIWYSNEGTHKFRSFLFSNNLFFSGVSKCPEYDEPGTRQTVFLSEKQRCFAVSLSVFVQHANIDTLKYIRTWGVEQRPTRSLSLSWADLKSRAAVIHKPYKSTLNSNGLLGHLFPPNITR